MHYTWSCQKITHQYPGLISWASVGTNDCKNKKNAANASDFDWIMFCSVLKHNWSNEKWKNTIFKNLLSDPPQPIFQVQYSNSGQNGTRGQNGTSGIWDKVQYVWFYCHVHVISAIGQCGLTPQDQTYRWSYLKYHKKKTRFRHIRSFWCINSLTFRSRHYTLYWNVLQEVKWNMVRWCKMASWRKNGTMEFW